MNGLGLILIVITSFFFTGMVFRTKSLFSGRKGPGIFQPMKDIWRLFQKVSVYSETCSFIFKIAPNIYFASVVIAMMLIPFWSPKGINIIAITTEAK